MYIARACDTLFIWNKTLSAAESPFTLFKFLPLNDTVLPITSSQTDIICPSRKDGQSQPGVSILINHDQPKAKIYINATGSLTIASR